MTQLPERKCHTCGRPLPIENVKVPITPEPSGVNDDAIPGVMEKTWREEQDYGDCTFCQR